MKAAGIVLDPPDDSWKNNPHHYPRDATEKQYMLEKRDLQKEWKVTDMPVGLPKNKYHRHDGVPSIIGVSQAILDTLELA